MSKVGLETVRTENGDVVAMADRLVAGLAGAQPRLAVLVADPQVDHGALNRAVRERLPGTRLIGWSSGGEIDREGIHHGTAILGALSGDFEVGLGAGTNLGMNALGAGGDAIDRAAAELGVKRGDIDTRTTVGMVVDDGYKWKKEELLLGVMEKNQGLVTVGGGAGSTEQDPAKQRATLHLDGEVFDDGVLVALFKTNAPWAALRAHPYRPTGRSITITKVDDETGTRALEIDGEPAAPYYAELLGVGVDELEFGLPKGFAKTSLALRVGREYFMRSPWKPLPDGSILCANVLEEDTTLELMELGDMAQMTKDFFSKELPEQVQNPQAALMFHCSGRYWLAQGSNTVPQLSDSFRAAPRCIGANCFFEIYSGFHINTTLTVLAFGSDD